MRRQTKFHGLLLSLFLLPATSIFATTIYVDSSATGANTGASWTAAFTDFQDALDAAQANDEIWVAKGTYYPSKDADGNSANDQTATFVMKNNVGIYGGFAGGETNRNNRDLTANPTIFSGDIDKNDVLDGPNSYHVFFNNDNGLDNTAILDGFIITGGNAIHANFPDNAGGGMYNRLSHPKVNNCIFLENGGTGAAAIDLNSSDPVITNCIFRANSGVFSILSNYGGAKSRLVNCVFAGNRLTNPNQALIFTNNSNSSVDLINCTLSGNSVGKVIYNIDGNCSLKNTIIWGNSNEIIEGPFTATYSLINGLNPNGTGNLDGTVATNNPHFVESVDPANAPSSVGDLQLLDCSPLLNIGDNTDIVGTDPDLAGNPRIYNGGVVDLGAYEYQDAKVNYSTTIAASATTITNGDQVTFTATNGGNYEFFVNNGSVQNSSSATYQTTDLVNNDKVKVVATNNQGCTAISAEITMTVNNRTIYVDSSATGANTGASWTAAFTDFQDALDAAQANDQIWVAKGTYYPSKDADGNSANDQTATFVMKNSIGIYGGFAGGETNRNNRDLTANPTIFSGDIDKNDVLDEANSYHVFFNNDNGLDNTAILDGFIITGGNAIHASYPDNAGGGMYNRLSHPKVNNCIFLENGGTGAAAIDLNSSDPVITNCIFRANSGVFSILSNYGGAKSRLVNCVFAGNRLTNPNQALIFTNNSNSSVDLINCTLSGNSVGKVLYNIDGNCTLKNTIIWGNSNDIIDGLFTATYSLINGLNPSGTGNLDGTVAANAPQFVESADPANAPSSAGDLRLIECSPLLNIGDNTDIVGTDPDLAGNPRIYNGGVIDLGAYEYKGDKLNYSTTFMASATSINSGDMVTFTATNGANYAFFVNDELVQDGNSATYQTTELGNNDKVKVVATNNQGCTATSAEITMTVNVTGMDEDNDTISDSEDVCPGGDDRINTDGVGMPDDCDCDPNDADDEYRAILGSAYPDGFNGTRNVIRSFQISIDAEIHAGSDISLTAGYEVLLKPGFHAQSGANFSAKLELCNDPNSALISIATERNSRNETTDLEQEQSLTTYKSEELKTFSENDIRPIGFKVQPNPFRNHLTTTFNLPTATSVTIRLFDAQGRLVRSILQNTPMAAGEHVVPVTNQLLNPGLYYLQLYTPDRLITRKVIAMK